MRMTMRWFGDNDNVTLSNIAQIPVVKGIVGTFEGKPADLIWSEDDFYALKHKVESHGLSLDVIESIPVAEAIKKGSPERDNLIDIFCESVRNMGKVGISILCYNFMPVFDWMRTDLQARFPDGSLTTAYEHHAMLDYDLSKGVEARVAWTRGYSGTELQAILDEYRFIDDDALFENLAYFLRRVVPVAEKAGVFLALHPDDPPWPIFGLPRIVRDVTSIQRILDVVDSPHNGLTFCTGSLGSSPENDLPAMVRQFAGRIHFAHLRNVTITGEQSFIEVAHSDKNGNVDLPEVIRALIEIGYAGPIRPDHGRMIWGETGRIGYGLYDRALAAMYLYGVWEGLNGSRGHRE